MRPRRSDPAAQGGTGKGPEITVHQGAADQPDIGVTRDHRLAQVRHKNAQGLSPYETVATPEGTVTIRRTFSTDGKLLEEVAERDGKRVPVPKMSGTK